MRSFSASASGFLKEQPAAFSINADGTVTVTYDSPQRAITKSQAVVLYDGETVIGGGTIV